MTTTPAANPTKKREPGLLIGFLTGCALALAIGVVVAYATKARGPEQQGSEPRHLEVYPSGRNLGTPRALPEPVAVHLLAGVVASDDRDASAHLEAILRLHSYAALRDVHSGAIALEWSPAWTLEDEADLRRGACTPGEELGGSRWLRSGVRPDPRGRPIAPDRDLRVFLRVDATGEPARIVAVACASTGSEHSQVFEGRPDREGPLLRELSAWLAATIGVADARAFEEAWERAPAPRGPAIGTYGDLLVASQDPARLAEPRLETSTLPEAARIVPEAAWLAAALDSDPDARADYLRSAAAQRVGFTAALEDLAAEQLAAGRLDLALATLARLSQEEARQRPVELLLAAELVERGRPAHASRLLDELPRNWRRTTAAARLHALAQLARSDPAAAERWAIAWTEADPSDAEALVVHGRVLRALGRPSAAAGAWRRACRTDSERRLDASVAWAADAGVEELGELVGFLDELEQGDRVALEPAVREVRAWAALGAGDPARAYAEYAALASAAPELPRLRRGACVASLRSGRAGLEACEDLELEPLAEASLAAALASRSVGRVPGWPEDPTDFVDDALELAPRDEDVVRSAVSILRTSRQASDEEQQAALARWRVVVGAGVEAPELPRPKRASD